MFPFTSIRKTYHLNLSQEKLLNILKVEPEKSEIQMGPNLKGKLWSDYHLELLYTNIEFSLLNEKHYFQGEIKGRIVPVNEKKCFLKIEYFSDYSLGVFFIRVLIATIILIIIFFIGQMDGSLMLFTAYLIFVPFYLYTINRNIQKVENELLLWINDLHKTLEHNPQLLTNRNSEK